LDKKTHSTPGCSGSGAPFHEIGVLRKVRLQVRGGVLNAIFALQAKKLPWRLQLGMPR
jgi:hypothetical protein